MSENKSCIICGKTGIRKDRKCCSVVCGNILKTKPRPSCLFCGQLCKNINQKYCSRKCATYSSKGKKQTKEVIEKRVANTNQEAKQEKRRKTMLDRYGVENATQLQEVKDKISSALKGRPQERTKEHQEKIIESKLRNGTTKHTEETKKKISESLYKTFADPDFDRSVFITSGSNGKNSKTGYYNGLYFRSSYEEMFLMFCDHYGILVESAANKNHCIKYLSNDGTIRSYYPDFYLPKQNTIVEIKPISMLEVGDTGNKILAAIEQICNYVVLTEVDGFLCEDNWEEFYECQVKYWS